MIYRKSEHWEVHRGGEPCGEFLSFLKNWDYSIVLADCDDVCRRAVMWCNVMNVIWSNLVTFDLLILTYESKEVGLRPYILMIPLNVQSWEEQKHRGGEPCDEIKESLNKLCIYIRNLLGYHCIWVWCRPCLRSGVSIFVNPLPCGITLLQNVISFFFSLSSQSFT
jgi:hypothetical protein